MVITSVYCQMQRFLNQNISTMHFKTLAKLKSYCASKFVSNPSIQMLNKKALIVHCMRHSVYFMEADHRYRQLFYWHRVSTVTCMMWVKFYSTRWHYSRLLFAFRTMNNWCDFNATMKLIDNKSMTGRFGSFLCANKMWQSSIVWR